MLTEAAEMYANALLRQQLNFGMSMFPPPLLAMSKRAYAMLCFSESFNYLCTTNILFVIYKISVV